MGGYVQTQANHRSQNYRIAWVGNELQDQLVPASDPVPLQALHVITGTSCFPL